MTTWMNVVFSYNSHVNSKKINNCVKLLALWNEMALQWLLIATVYKIAVETWKVLKTFFTFWALDDTKPDDILFELSWVGLIV